MQRYSKFVKNICPSQSVNAWIVELAESGERFAILPAHVATRMRDTGQWEASKFIAPLSSRFKLDWNISLSYVEDLEKGMGNSIPNDLAWARFPSNCDLPALTISDNMHSLDLPCEVNVFFQQPYNGKGEWVDKGSTFGACHGIVYPSPESNMLEVLDMGFKGMSGALVVDANSKNSVPDGVGMLIRTANHIPFNDKKSKLLSSRHLSPVSRPVSTSAKLTDPLPDYNLFSATPSGASSSSGAAYRPAPPLSGEIKVLYDLLKEDMNQRDQLLNNKFKEFDNKFKEFDNKFKEFDNRFNEIDNRFNKIDNRFNEIDSKFSYIAENMLRSDDLTALLNVARLRRALVMPFAHIHDTIMHGKSMSLLQLCSK
jgi:hypothetical protein